MWPRLVSLALGVWLMAAPAVLGYGEPARTNDRVVGPVVASVAVVAMAEVVRSLRWANLVAGFWLLLAPWVLLYGPVSTWHSIGVGLLLLALAPIRGRVRQCFGGGWRAIAGPPGPNT
jgi:hypothetical protein